MKLATVYNIVQSPNSPNVIMIGSHGSGVGALDHASPLCMTSSDEAYIESEVSSACMEGRCADDM